MKNISQNNQNAGRGLN